VNMADSCSRPTRQAAALAASHPAVRVADPLRFLRLKEIERPVRPRIMDSKRQIDNLDEQVAAEHAFAPDAVKIG
jgi:hypothetical protein